MSYGRPPSGNARQFRGRPNFTADEWAELERRALLRGVGVAEYLRERALADSYPPSEALALSSAAGVPRRA